MDTEIIEERGAKPSIVLVFHDECTFTSPPTMVRASLRSSVAEDWEKAAAVTDRTMFASFGCLKESGQSWSTARITKAAGPARCWRGS